MATIYRKTDKGQAEIETRLFMLLPRMRTALILVDGRRTETQLARLIPGDPAASLQALLDEGFIELTTRAEPPSPPPASPSPPSPLAPPSPPVPPAPPPAHYATIRAASTPAKTPLQRRRREAMRALHEQLGAQAEPVMARMEQCHDWHHLLPMLQIARQVLLNARGVQPAADFASRFINTPLG